MSTERPSPRYRDIDVWPPADALDAMIDGQFGAVAAVRAARPAIEAAVLAIESRLGPKGRLVYAGAGTSGRLVAQDGAELMPTFGWPSERLLVLLAGGQAAMMRAVEGAEDDAGFAAELVARHDIGGEDVLIAVTASGTTPFTLTCLKEAARRGALTVGMANNAGTPVLTEAAHPILLETGPEPVAGSTRMNAGTAQRIALGLMSTLLMIRSGRVYRGLMVDVQASNAKLVRRSEAMLGSLTGKEASEIRAALKEAEGNLKIAALLLKGCCLEEARELLERSGGRLRGAIGLFGKMR